MQPHTSLAVSRKFGKALWERNHKLNRAFQNIMSWHITKTHSSWHGPNSYFTDSLSDCFIPEGRKTVCDVFWLTANAVCCIVPTIKGPQATLRALISIIFAIVQATAQVCAFACRFWDAGQKNGGMKIFDPQGMKAFATECNKFNSSSFIDNFMQCIIYRVMKRRTELKPLQHRISIPPHPVWLEISTWCVHKDVGGRNLCLGNTGEQKNW